MRIVSILQVAGLAIVAAALAGCGVVPSVPTVTTKPAAISGKVFGGQQPISSATVQLYTVGTSGDGSYSNALLTQPVTTDANGNFNITGLYHCTNATQVYMTSTGGYVSGTTQNPNAVLMAALGPCTSLSASTVIIMNELTTVAAVNALSPYMTSASAIGSGTSDVLALDTAFTLAGAFVNTATGTAPGNVPTGYTAPTAEINTLGDAMANCVNSGGGVANDGTACGNLFKMTTPSSGTAPADTVAALLNVAKNPSLNTAWLYNSAPPSAPFQPQLATQPADFSVVLTPSPNASLTLSPSSLSFSTVPVGGTTPLQVAALTNTGTTPVAISSIAIAGSNAGDFGETSICPSLLYPGNYCTIETTFSPTATGSRTASLQVNGGALSTGLSGSGSTSSTAAPTLSVSSLYYGVSGQQQLVTLSNFDSNPLGIKSIKFGTSNYTEVDNCNGSLGGQSFCNIYITALSVGNNDTMTITDSAGKQTVTLIAAGYGASVSWGAELIGNSTGSGPQSIKLNYDLHSTNYMGYEYYGGNLTFTNPNATLTAYSNYGLYGCSSTSVFGCTLNIFFTTSTLGWQYDYGTDTGGVGYLLSAFGTSSGSAIVASPLALNYGGTIVGQKSQLTLTVTSAGGAAYNPVPFTYSGVSFSGGNKADFSLVSTTCSTLSDPLSSCTIKIQFTPQAAGVRSSTLTIPNPGGIAASVLVAGVGYSVLPVTTYTAPTALPSSLTFPSTAVGSSATPLSTTVTMPNLDAASATITGSGFGLSGGSSCAQGASSCQFTVSFAPTGSGAATGTLTVTDTLTNTTATVALSGTGTTPPPPPPVVSLSPSSLTFSPRSVGQQSIPQTITLTNTGGSSLTISSVTLGGTNAGDYAMTNGCSGLIAVNGTCSISVSNDPTFVGASSASITIVSNAASSPNVIALAGTGQ